MTTSVAVLGATLSTHAVQAAPPGLKASTLAATARASAEIATRKFAAGKALAGLQGWVLAKVGLVAGLVGVGALIVAAWANQSREVVVRPASSNRMGGAAAPHQPAGSGAGGNAPQAASRPLQRLFHLIPANTCNQQKGASDGNDHIGFIKAGDWLRFNDVDLGQPGSEPVTFSAAVACPDSSQGARMLVRTDRLDGPIIATLAVQPTGGYSHFVAQTAPVTGASGGHVIFIVFEAGGFNLQSIQFLQTGRSAFMTSRAQSYYAASKLQNRGDVVCEIQDGAWARYDGLEFGAGADAFSVAWAVDEKHAGGTIGVRLDRRDGPLLCAVPVESTGNWGRFTARTVRHDLVQGRHDVFLTFSSDGKTNHEIANVKWFSFDGPGAKAAPASARLQPMPEPPGGRGAP